MNRIPTLTSGLALLSPMAGEAAYAQPNSAAQWLRTLLRP